MSSATINVVAIHLHPDQGFPRPIRAHHVTRRHDTAGSRQNEWRNTAPSSTSSHQASILLPEESRATVTPTLCSVQSLHLSIDKTSHAPAGSRRRGFGCTLPVPHVLLRSQSDLGPCPPDAASEWSTGGAELLFRPPERGKGRRYAVTAPQRRPRSRAWILPGEEQAVGATSQPRISVYRHRDTSPCLSQKPRSPPPGSLLSCRQRACGARSSAHTSTEIGDAKKRQTGSKASEARARAPVRPDPRPQRPLPTQPGHGGRRTPFATLQTSARASS